MADEKLKPLRLKHFRIIKALIFKKLESYVLGTTHAALEKRVKALEDWYNSFPASDNKTYGVKNRKPEQIADANEKVYTGKADS